MTTIRSGKAAVGKSGKPNTPFSDPSRLCAASGAQVTALRTAVPGERGENCTVGTLALTVASSDVVGSVTYTLRRFAERVPWSEPTWNKLNALGVTGTSVTVTVSDPADGAVLTFDVAALCQSAIDGPHYGWRLTSSSASVTKFYGFDTDDGPVLDLTVTDNPGAATDQVPNGTGSKEKPFLQWTAPDLNGGDNQSAFRVQIATTATPAEDAEFTWTAPTYDSGTVVDPAPELDLSATAYAGLALGSTFYWQVRWKSETGLWAPWSETAAYTREALPTWTFNTPSAGSVSQVRPTFSATFSGAAGALKAYRYRLALTSKPHRIIADSRKQRASSNTPTWDPMEMSAFVGDDRDPITLQDGESYILTIDGWRAGTTNYVASVGDPIAVRGTVTFTVNQAVGVEAPVITGVAAHATLPINEVTLTRSTMPDSFVLYRGGVAVASFEAADVHVSGTTYRLPDTLAKPMRTHAYKVRAGVDATGLSALSNEVSASLTPKGVWLVSKDRTKSIQLGGAPPSLSRQDTAGIYVIQGQDDETQNVVIRSGRGKVNDAYTGQVAKRSGERSEADQLDDLDAMWESEDPVYLIAANTSTKVRLLDYSASPHEDIMESREWTVVSFRFVQVG